MIAAIYFLAAVPESPKWQYINDKFDEARESLLFVGKFNGLSDRRMSRLRKLIFDIEVMQKLKNMEADAVSSKKESLEAEINRRKDTISERQYIINIVLLSIQWSAASFTFYMLMFMNKYYEGTIYSNFYLDSAAAILGPTLSILVY